MCLGLASGLLLRWLIIKSIRLGLQWSDHESFLLILRKIKAASLVLVPTLVIFLVFTFYDSDVTHLKFRIFFQVILILSGTWFLIRLTYVFEYIILRKFDITKADNANERRVITQLNFLRKLVIAVFCVIGLSAILLSFNGGRKFGAGLITSAGILSVIVGFAAQKSIANLFAGLQIAFTQPIKFDDVVIVEKEWGRIEEINLTYVVVKLWDLRRLVVPITYFVEQPFQNWTRTDASLIGVVFIYTDFRLPLEPLRRRLTEYLSSDALWDGLTQNIQVTDATEKSMQLRILVSARNSSDAFDLRCNVRETLIAFVRDEFSEFLPVTRVSMGSAG